MFVLSSLVMIYLFLKAMHIIFAVAWFAGLFYLGRIFVYHKEAIEQQNDSTQYTLMERRAYGIICNPAMMITWLCGLGMIGHNGLDWLMANQWLIAKLVLLIGLTIYHLSMKSTIAKLEARLTKVTSFSFRLYNEIPTMFLFSIVFLAVFRNTLNAIYGIIGLFVLGASLYGATKMYRRIREKNTTST